MSRPREEAGGGRGWPWRPVLAYAIFGVAWILGTDALEASVRLSFPVQTLKGLLFVVCSAALGAFLLRREVARREALGRRSQRWIDSTAEALDRLDQPMFVIRHADRIIEGCNRAAAACLGYTVEELVGQSTELIHPDRSSFERFGAAGMTDLDAEAVFHSRGQLRRKDGALIDTEHTVAFLDDEHTRAISLFRNITRTLRDRRRLEAQERRHRMILDQISDVVALLEPDGMVRWVNAAVTSVLGWSSDEVVGKPLAEVVHEDDLQLARGELERVVAGNDSRQPTELRLRHRDGSTRTVESLGRYVVSKQAPGIVLVSRDVTERNRTLASLQEKEEQLQRAQRLEAIGRLAGGIAHDFNNVLTVIFAALEFLREDREPDDASSEDLQLIEEAASKGQRMTRQLLAFSRGQPVSLSVLDLGTFLPEMEGLLGSLIGEDIEIELDLPEEPLPILADRGQLEQVILNLAVNARDAMPDGGCLRLRARAEAPPGPDGASPGILLEVEDTGEGMTPQTRQKIFEPFFTTKEQGRGTGLGLATVFGIVEKLEGKIEVRSEVGVGTTFALSFPRFSGPSRQESHTVRKTEGPSSRAASILVVEDEDAVRQAIRRILEGAGFRTLTATNAEEAEAVFAKAPEPVDLLLTDIVMPGRNGHELALSLRKRHPELAVVYISGYTEDRAVLVEIRESEALLVPKPFDREALLEGVHAALDR